MWLLAVCLLKGLHALSNLLAFTVDMYEGKYIESKYIKRCNYVPSVVANARHNVFCLSVLVCVSC
jgi:hypothetical protein